MASFDFGIKISAQDSASGVISGIQQKMTGMGSSVGTAFASAGQRMATFGLAAGGIREAAGALEGFSRGFVELDTATQSMKTLGADGAKLAPILKNTAISMAKDIPFAASQIQGAMTDALASGIEPTEAGLSGFANTAAKLAAGSGTELGVVVKGLAGTLNAYGASASEATKYADIFFDVNNAGVTSIQELNAYMPALNASANALGLSFADAGRGIALMTQKGVSTADSSTQIKALFTEMAKPSANFVKFMKEAGISMNQLQTGSLEDRLTAIRAGLDKTGKKADTIFGSSEAATAIKVMTGDMKKMGEVFASVDANGSGSSGNAFKEMQQSVAVRTKQMEARIDAFKIQALDSMGSFGVGIVSATSQFAKMSDEVTALAGLKSLIPPGAFGSLASGAKSAFTSVSGVAASGIGAVSGQIGRFTNSLRGFSFGGVFSSLRTGAASAVSGLSGVLSTGVSSLRTFAAQQLIAARGSALFSTGVTGFFRTLGGGLAQGLGAAMKGILSLNMAFLTSPVTWIALGIAGAAFLIYKNWDNIVAYFKGMFKGFSESLYPVKQAWDGLMTAINPLIEGIKKLFTPTKQAGGALTAIGYAGEAAGKVIAAVFNTIVPPMLWVIKSVLSGISIFAGFQKSGSNAAKVVAGALSLIFAPILAIKGLLSGLITFFSEAFSGVSLYDAGAHLMKSLWEGIKGWFGNVLDGVKGIVGGITNLFSGKKDNPALRTSDAIKEAAAKPAEVAKPKAPEMPAIKPPEVGKPKIPKPDAPKLRPLNPPEAPDFSWIKKQKAEPPKINKFPPIEPPEIGGKAGAGKPIELGLPEALKSVSTEGTKILSENSAAFKLPELQLPKLDSLKDFKLPEIGLPKLDSLKDFKLPEIGLPKLEDVVPGLQLPDFTKGLPKVQLPDVQVPKFETPGLDSILKTLGIEKPTLPPITLPEAQDVPVAGKPIPIVGTPAKSGASGGVTVNFSVNLNMNATGANGAPATATDIAEQVSAALRKLAPDLAREVQNAMEQDKRLQFAGF